MTLDDRVLEWVVARREPWLTDIFTVITNAGGILGMFVASTVLAAGLLIRGYRREAFLVGSAMVSSLLLLNLVKVLVARERPPWPDRLVLEASYSFPSGHAMLSATLATVAAAAVVRLRGRSRSSCAAVVLFAVAAVLDGLSRVYLGAHWFTDVLAGWLVGTCWAYAWIRGTARLPSKN